MTIGAVCKALSQEFPDISISKIRYLEDQKLLAPSADPGGYRLYSSGDVTRLRTILRLQRDEFLPLRVIRQELATGAASEEEVPAPKRATRARGAARRRQRARPRRDVLARGRARGDARGGLDGQGARGVRRHQGARAAAASATTTRPSARSSAPSPELARYGVGGATCAPSARRPTARRPCCSRSSRRRCGPATRSGARRRSRPLENLAVVTTHLKHLLLIRTCCASWRPKGGPVTSRRSSGDPDFPKPGSASRTSRR